MKKNWRVLFGFLVLISMTLVLTACSGGGQDVGAGGTGGGDTAGVDLKPGEAGFQEFPIGEEKEVEGIAIGGVYFQAVDMEPKEKAGMGSEGDIHLEADIKGLKNNRAGFGFGDFIPYLKVDYEIKSLDTGEEQSGSMMPMNASDGPHYGRNVKMSGAGKYLVKFTIESPEKMDYLLHVDKETGVPGRFWKKPIEVSWEFNYVPLSGK